MGKKNQLGSQTPFFISSPVQHVQEVERIDRPSESSSGDGESSESETSSSSERQMEMDYGQHNADQGNYWKKKKILK